MNNYHFLTLSIFLFLSCSEKKSEIQNSPSLSSNFLGTADASKEETVAVSYASPKVASDEATAIPVEINSSHSQKKIIRNASIRFQVEDYKKSALDIENAVKNSGGYISTSQEENNNYGLSTTMTIRVGSPKFDALINELLKESKFLNYKNVTADDVTAQFVDTEARLKTKKEVEKRYLDILKQAKTIEDILKVESQLAGIREEIEAKEGQLKLMNDQVNYSTIQLEYYESIEAAVQQEDGFFARIKKGIKTGWNVLIGFVVGIFYIWPFLILAGLVLFLFRRWKGNKTNAKPGV